MTNGHSEPLDNITPTVALIGKGMLKNNALLPALLRVNEAELMRWYPWDTLKFRKADSDELPTFAGWGHKKSYRRARRVASKLNQPVISVEDGFLRSLTSGIHSRYGCSIVIDTQGIYFDARSANDLDTFIIERMANWTPAKADRANHAIQQILTHKLSKYNATTSCLNLNEMAGNKEVDIEHVLIIDQVAGDASIEGAGATAKTFRQMLKTACLNHPNSHIWIKTHPAKVGYLTPKVVAKVIKSLPKSLKSSLQNRLHILNQPANAIALLEQVSDVYTVSSHMGFEALMLGKTVHNFGRAWYAEGGLTDDTHLKKVLPKKLIKQVQQRHERIKRGANLPSNIAPTLTQLFYASYIDYARYADPASGQGCDLETVIHWLATNSHWRKRLPDTMTIYEFSRWKLPFVRAFLQPMTIERSKAVNEILTIKPKPRWRNRLHPNHFTADLSQDVLVWGLKQRQTLEAKRSALMNVANDSNIWCMEDGFIRSNGLGATLLAPLSVVLDATGIYYDATRPSDLEYLLKNSRPLTEEQTVRVEALRERLLAMKVSKYNVGQSATFATMGAHNRQRILIVGQVEDDLSVKHCLSPITTNADLIKQVRADNPKAYLVYKPHPDVEAGLRMGKVDKRTLKLVDEIAHDMAMPDCLDAVDAVHTISSLTGFEALLRSKTVTCYGLPFYAGWRLTRDRDVTSPDVDIVTAREQTLERRQRQTPLTLNQLIHSTLIDYPLYRLPDGYGLAQVEQVIEYLYGDAKNGQITATNHQQTQENSITPNKTSQAVQKQPFTKKQKLAKRFMQARHHALSLKRRLNAR